MNWDPLVNLIGPTGPSGPPMKTGKYVGSGPTTITFGGEFLDTNYIVLLTPYVNSTPSGIPMAWVTNLTTTTFDLNSSGVDGVYWTAYANI